MCVFPGAKFVQKCIIASRGGGGVCGGQNVITNFQSIILRCGQQNRPTHTKKAVKFFISFFSRLCAYL